VNKLDFRIAGDAAEYLRKYLLRSDTGESLVLMIVPMTPAKMLASVDPKLSYHELAAMAKEHFESLSSPSELSSPIELEWVVGAMQRSNLPGAAETVLIDGIECFFPDEVRSVLKGRVLQLRLGQLVFDPALDPPPSIQTQQRD